MRKSLIDSIEQDLKDRSEWATQQELWYRMRTTGVQRTLPFPGASNLHYPLGDTFIRKLAPSYVQQMYGGENICTFVALRQQDQELTTGISGWFDYSLKQKTNFERCMFVAIDQMLECGFTPIKVYWDAKKKRVAFEQIDPLHVIVPQTTEEYNESGGADRLVHVLHMSVDQYKANPKFDQDPVVIKRIKGKGNADSDGQNKADTVDYKEGINCSHNDEEIVLWEVYQRDRLANRITVSTVSPLLPPDENEVREEFTLPYNKGCFAGGDHFPFFMIRHEINGKGYYSSRGIIQINMAFEASLTASWNHIHDHMAFSSKPNYENTGAYPIPNAGQFRNAPGKVLPPGLKLAIHPEPPSSLREDIEMTRAIAEDGIQMPNFGASEHLTGNIPDSKTATGQQLIAAQSSQGTDMRARVFKMDMAVGLKLAWSLYQQYEVDQQTLQYLSGSDVKTVDATAIHDDYSITPNGSADSWNKAGQVTKRMAYYDKFIENPYIKKGELTKWTMEAEDPQMVKRLYVDPGIQAKDQEEAQALECLLMQEGYAPQIHDADDDRVHLAVIDMYAQSKIQKVEMTSPLAQMLLDHGTQHLGALKNKKDPMLSQVEAKLRPTAEALAMIAAQAPPAPKNVLPMMQQPVGADQSSGEVQSTAQPTAAAPISSEQQPNTGAM